MSKRAPSKREPRCIAVLIYPGLQALDAVGPLEVFAGANAVSEALGKPAPYRLELIAPEAGPQLTESGYALVAPRAYRELRGPIDTLLVVGGNGSRVVRNDPKLRAWLQRAAKRVRRLCSVCTGALVLAEAGLLDGRRATTHWARLPHLEQRHPKVRVERDPIFVRDGSIYTSAGVTAGIDLSLALVGQDEGPEIARTVAQWLVVFLQRPGGQAQFSAHMAAPPPTDASFHHLQAFIAEHPGEDLSVPALASRMAMSPRNFARRFREQLGVSPAQYVLRARVEHARARLEQSDDSIERIAERSGFGTEETMRRSFQKLVHVPPRNYRQRFAAKGVVH
jgi:transcriptional regulator GlxA family with amidase domain